MLLKGGGGGSATGSGWRALWNRVSSPGAPSFAPRRLVPPSWLTPCVMARWRVGAGLQYRATIPARGCCCMEHGQCGGMLRMGNPLHTFRRSRWRGEQKVRPGFRTVRGGDWKEGPRDKGVGRDAVEGLLFLTVCSSDRGRGGIRNRRGLEWQRVAQQTCAVASECPKPFFRVSRLALLAQQPRGNKSSHPSNPSEAVRNNSNPPEAHRK